MARTPLAVVAVALGLFLLTPAHAVIVPSLKQPTWAELSVEQKHILAPLASEWDKLEAYRRQKWIGIAQHYPAMNSEEQARVQRRMKDWVKLTPEERTAAREKYKSLQKAPPEHKEVIKQKWNEYKQLPEEERQRLKEEAAKAKPQPKPGKPALTPPPALTLPPAAAAKPSQIAPVAAPAVAAPSAAPASAPANPAQQ